MNKREGLEILSKIATVCNGRANCKGCPFSDKYRGCLVYVSVNEPDSATIINDLLETFCAQSEEGQKVANVLNQILANKEHQDHADKETTDNINVLQDSVHHPKYYLKGGMEGIDVIKAAVSNLSGFEAVCVANIIKYIWRYKEKNGLEDVMKAGKYLEWLIKEVEK